jgi:hypothetical protein
MNEIHATVHDTLVIEGRAWAVTGVFLGGLGQESVLGLQVIGERFDATAYGQDVPELFVPEIIIRKGIAAGFIELRPSSLEQPQ